MNSKTKLRRDLMFVGAATLVALAPIVFLLRKSTISPTVEDDFSPSTLRPVLAKMSLGEKSYLESPATLSPDGRWLARMEVAALAIGATPAPNGPSPRTDELVIRSSTGGQEAFRVVGVGRFVGWIAGSSAFVARNGTDINVFLLAVARPGAPRPKQMWTQQSLSFTQDSSGIITTTDSDGVSESLLARGEIVFSPDFRFAVKGSWDDGTIVWEVADLLKGKIAPPVRAGRWLNFDPHVGGNSSDISIRVGPTGVVAGAKPVVAVVQTTRIEPKFNPNPTPTPTPTPFPTPTPTPTFSAEQQAFTTREARERAQIQALVESVVGVDGADPQVTDPEEMSRIEGEVHTRNHALDRERKRLFPPLPPVAPLYTPPGWNSTKPYSIECFDLNSGKRLWTCPLRTQVFEPGMAFAPDGSALVAWGTSVMRQQNDRTSLVDAGLRFFDTRTGRALGQNEKREDDFGISRSTPMHFYEELASQPSGKPRSILVLAEHYTPPHRPNQSYAFGQGRALRFFDVARAREIGFLKIDMSQFPRKAQPDFDSFSISQSGHLWEFGNAECFVLPRADLGKDVFAPFPTPTPFPTSSVPASRRAF